MWGVYHCKERELMGWAWILIFHHDNIIGKGMKQILPPAMSKIVRWLVWYKEKLWIQNMRGIVRENGWRISEPFFCYQLIKEVWLVLHTHTHTHTHTYIYIYIYIYICSNVIRKVGDRSRGRPEGSLVICYDTTVYPLGKWNIVLIAQIRWILLYTNRSLPLVVLLTTFSVRKKLMNGSICWLANTG